MADGDSAEVLELTAKIVAAQGAKNRIATDTLPELIETVYRSLLNVGSAQPGPAAPKMPAVSIRKSVFPDYIVCLEDGKKLKMLKRYLQTTYGLSPNQYRQKWGLPADYPMVSPNYASHRSRVAKQIGLGRKLGGPKANDVVEETSGPASKPEPSVTQGRPRRARGSRG